MPSKRALEGLLSCALVYTMPPSGGYADFDGGSSVELPSPYEHDFYSWTIDQARLLREGRYDALDRDNLAEEIESLGREQFNKLVSALRVLMVYVLKWDHQPALRSLSWVLSIEGQRLEIADVLADNPGLKPRIAETTARAYRRARLRSGERNRPGGDCVSGNVSLFVRRHHIP